MATKGYGHAFISNDRNFRAKDGALHEHLKQDVMSRVIPIDRVVFFRDVRQCIDSHIRPHIEAFESLHSNIEYGRLHESGTANLIGQSVQDYFRQPASDPDELNSPGNMNRLLLDVVDEVSAIKVSDIGRLTQGEIFAGIVANLAAKFSVFIFKADYYALVDDPDLDLLDSDWNQHYILASTTKNLRGEFDLFNPDNPENASYRHRGDCRD